MRDRDHAKLPTGKEIGLLTLVIIGIGTSGPVIALGTMPIVALIFWRNLGGFFLVLPWADKKLNLRDPKTRNGVLLAILAGAALAAHFFGFFLAMRLTSVATGTALAALQPIFAAYFVRLLGGYIPRHVWIGMIVAFVGVLVITGVDLQISTRAFLGDLAAIGCAAIPPNPLCVAFACSECSSIVHLMKRLAEAMPYHRNFTYHIDKRRWKYHFLMVALCENRQR